MSPRRSLLSAAAMLATALLAGCATLPRSAEDNTARWIAHPEFASAVRAAPHLMSDIFTTTTRLEEALAKKKD